MNNTKCIKDLKERNDKLKNQYELLEIRYEHNLAEMENYKRMLTDAIKELGSCQFKIKKARDYIIDMYKDEYISYGNKEELLKILGVEDSNENN